MLIITNGYNANGWVTARWTAAKGLASFAYDANGNLLVYIQGNVTGKRITVDTPVTDVL